MRRCDRCNAGMNDGRPRVRVNQQFWCQTCAKDTASPSGKYKPGSDIRVGASQDSNGVPTRNLGPVDLFAGSRDDREVTQRSQHTRAIGNAARAHGMNYGSLIKGMRELGMIGRKHTDMAHRRLADTAVNKPDEFRALVHIVKQHHERKGGAGKPFDPAVGYPDQSGRTAGLRATASDWHQFDTNRHYRRGHQDGAQGVFDQDHDSLSAKADMGIPLEPHEVDYMAGHAAGMQRAREHAQAQHDIKKVWDDHGKTYSSLEPHMAIKIALREQKTGQRLFVLAHDSGDGETIYHCPFCGSGQVIARSDRTIECEFCHTSFTVQVQPEYSAFPQTMDGQPVQVPGMPGQIDAPVGGGPQDPSIAAPDSDGDGIPDQAGGFDPAAAASAQNQPPWLTAGLKTQAGKVLPVQDYVAHLALKHSGDRRTAVLRRVRASRETS